MAQISENRLVGSGSSWICADCRLVGGRWPWGRLGGYGGVAGVNPPQSWRQPPLKEGSLPAKCDSLLIRMP